MSSLIERYVREYMETVFYFCLKKTGNSQDAEDLTSDISLNVVTELSKGTIPRHFSAWVWQIARNRYSLWADKKHRKNAAMSGADIAQLELAADTCVEQDYIRREDLSLLRRELAFISSDYRTVVVAFYLDDIKAKDIAARLDLPESTVRSKLFRARRILKEGMSMAREFGAMSYRPENVGFIMNGISGKYGQPWTIISHMLNKNILLAAYRTPSTAGELAVELGVALPYMEDELTRLVEATLLRKNGSKYETNIVIVSAQAQARVYANLRTLTPELTRAMTALLTYEMRCHKENGSAWSEGFQPYEDAKWALLMQTVDAVNSGVLSAYRAENQASPPASLGRWGHTIRPDGGEWDLLGLENYDGDRPAFVGLHGCFDTPAYIRREEMIDFGQFRFQYRHIDRQTPEHVSYEEARALVQVVNGQASAAPPSVLADLVTYGYLKRNGDRYTPTFLVVRRDKQTPRTPAQETEHRRLFDEAVHIGLRHYRFCREVVCAEIPDFLQNDRYQIDHACANIYSMRGAVLEEAIRTGFLSYEETGERRMLGAYLTL